MADSAKVNEFSAWLEKAVNTAPEGVEGWSPILSRGDMYYELIRDTHCQAEGCEATYSCDEERPPSQAGWGAGKRGELCPEHYTAHVATLAKHGA